MVCYIYIPSYWTQTNQWLLLEQLGRICGSTRAFLFATLHFPHLQRWVKQNRTSDKLYAQCHPPSIPQGNEKEITPISPTPIYWQACTILHSRCILYRMFTLEQFHQYLMYLWVQ